MIKIIDKKQCCGCSACSQVCPKSCISLLEDVEGFLYPKVDSSRCIECGLCEKVCPCLNNKELGNRLFKIYAGINKNEAIRLKSSSGGIFSALAEKIISEGGVVFGAKFNEHWIVEHGSTEKLDGLADFRGSKYVQSKIGNAFNEVLQLLRQNRKVLFSGTPCQVAGLKLFLRKDFDNLLTVDFICHGVPSPKVWREYLKTELSFLQNRQLMRDSDLTVNVNSFIENISFRDKTDSWRNYNFIIQFKPTAQTMGSPILLTYKHDNNPYMKGFLANLDLRPSCYACPARSGKSLSDITLGDFWTESLCLNKFNDDKGTSLIIDFTSTKIVKEIKTLDLIEIDASHISEVCPGFIHSSDLNGNRALFFQALGKKSVIKLFQRYAYPRLHQRILNFIERKYKQ